MQLSSKSFGIGESEIQLKKYFDEHSLDLVLGVMPVEGGVFVLLFSWRLNKQVGIILEGITDTHAALHKLKKTLRSAS